MLKMLSAGSLRVLLVERCWVCFGQGRLFVNPSPSRRALLGVAGLETEDTQTGDDAASLQSVLLDHMITWVIAPEQRQITVTDMRLMGHDHCQASFTQRTCLFAIYHPEVNNVTAGLGGDSIRR